MNRRHFISGTAALAALGMGFKSGLLAQGGPVKMPARKPETPKTEFVSLRRNVGIFNGRGGTIGWLSSAEALAIVDTQFPNTAQICLDGLPARDGRMIDVVINTHHHGDHTSGNPVFRPVAKKLVAQENVPALMRGRAIQDKKPVEDLVIADTTFADTWKMELGDEVVSARYFGPAHTKGDIAVLFEKANVVHVGDLLFNRIYPVIDRPGGASIAGWIQRLETIQKEYPADALYVGGHGNPKFGVVAKRGELAVFRDYLSALLDYTQKAIDAGRSKAEIVTLENFPGFADFHLPLPNRLSGNLSVAYDELTAAKG
jgi:glyoxylase-like metal-dependent hydrolase (beta-lactamase superfamily II)